MLTHPLPTRLFSLVSLDDPVGNVAHFRTPDAARAWAGRWYGSKWRLELMLWDNTLERAA